MTARILKAFDNPHVNIFGHPTGRKINRRDPYDFDFVKVAKVAKEKGIAMEVDAQPARLDLKDSHIRKAIELEQRSVSFYLDRADQVETPEQQALFKQLAEEEKKHLRLLDCLLDFVASPKTWLEDAEFNRLDEY